jgi:hypothetical protein
MQDVEYKRSLIMHLRAPAWAAIFFLLSVVGTNGCGSPSAANILLRKQNQELQTKVDSLSDQHQRDVATLAACERSHPTTAQLPPDRLEQLTTTHGLQFSHLTGGDNPDSTQGSDTELKVFVVPIDADGTPIKAAGTFKIEAFDLDDPAKPLIGTWKFDLDQTRASFYNRFSMYTYGLICPFQIVPRHANLTIKVTFDEALTGREFVDQVRATVRPPA